MANNSRKEAINILTNELKFLNSFERRRLINAYNLTYGKREVSLPRIFTRFFLSNPYSTVEDVLNLLEDKATDIDNEIIANNQLNQEPLFFQTNQQINEPIQVEQPPEPLLPRGRITGQPYGNSRLDTMIANNYQRDEPIEYEPIEETQTPVERLLTTANNFDDLMEALASQIRNGRTHFVIETRNEQKNKVRTNTYTIPKMLKTNTRIYNWFKSTNNYWSFHPDTATSVYDGGMTTSYIYSNDNLNPYSSSQSFRDGRDYNCVLDPVKNYYLSREQTKNTKCFLKKIERLLVVYVNGVPESDMEFVANELRVQFVITLPLCSETKTYGKMIYKRFTLMNTRLNHIEQGADLNTSNIIMMKSRNELLDFKQSLDDAEQPNIYTKDSININSVITAEGRYTISSDFNDTIKEFEERNGLDNYKLDDFKDAELTAYIKTGTHYNDSCMMGGGRPYYKDGRDDETQHIDKVKAYKSYENNPYYIGFVGKITDMRPTDRIEGEGIYTIQNLDWTKVEPKMIELVKRHIKAYISGGTYISPELKFLQVIGVKFDITYGCWGVKTFNMSFDDTMNKKTEEGTPYYSRLVGKWDSHNPTKSYWVSGTKEYAEMINENANGKDIAYFENGEIKITIPKTSNQHLGHITAFILGYMRLDMIRQLYEMELDKINFVYVDGIYYQPHKFKLLNGFVNKPSDWRKHYTGSKFKHLLKQRPHIKDDEPIRTAYLSNNTRKDNFENLFKLSYRTNQRCRTHYHKELYKGAGGTGKTHENMIDTGLIRPLYVGLSYKLTANNKQEYNSNTEVFENLINEEARVFKSKTIHKFYNTLIIDEASQLRNCDIKRIFELYDEHKIIVIGDIGFQTEPIAKGTGLDQGDITDDLFDNVIIRTHSYRITKTDDPLHHNLQVLRDNITNKRIYSPHSVKFLLNDENTLYLDDLLDCYEPNETIITGTNKASQQINDLLIPHKPHKYITTVRTKDYNKGEILFHKDPSKEFKGIISHAFTIHSIQGETIKDNLYIDLRRVNKNFNYRLLYTALSRAKSNFQIFYIIDDPNKEEIEEEYEEPDYEDDD